MRMPLYPIMGTTEPPYDPAVLSLKAWWRASFAGTPWVGTASAGTSASRDLNCSSTNQPGTGRTVNGLTAADFDGTNDTLDYSAAGDLLSVSAGTVSILFYPDNTGGNDTDDPTSNPHLFMGGGAYVGMSYVDSSVQAYLYDSAYNNAPPMPAAPGSWHVAQCKWNGSSLFARVDRGAWEGTIAGNVGSLAGALRVGFYSTYFFNGMIADIIVTNSALSDEVCDSLLDYVEARYALTL